MKDVAIFTMYNKSEGENVTIFLRKSLITSVVSYPNYYTVHYSTGGNFDGSYKVQKDFNIENLFE